MGDAPNPGSDIARALGCICPVMDNNRGLFPVFFDDDGVGQFWIAGGCPVHAPEISVQFPPAVPEAGESVSPANNEGDAS